MSVDLPASVLQARRDARSRPGVTRAHAGHEALRRGGRRTSTGILNDAWAGNWGFTPTTEAETAPAGQGPEAGARSATLIWFAEIDGETAGFVVLLPNVNEAIADLDGKLLPLRLGQAAVAPEGRHA